METKKAAALLPETAPRLRRRRRSARAAKRPRHPLVPFSSAWGADFSKPYLRTRTRRTMNRKVVLLSGLFDRAKGTGAELAAAATPRRAPRRPQTRPRAPSKRPRGVRFDEAPKNCAPAKVLDFGAGPSSALWAMRAVWPKSIEKVNLIEPSKEMQRAGQSLLDSKLSSHFWLHNVIHTNMVFALQAYFQHQLLVALFMVFKFSFSNSGIMLIIIFTWQILIDLKGLPLIHSYDSIQDLNRDLEKHERGHDLVISISVVACPLLKIVFLDLQSYALGEIPSLNDRITIVRQLWDLTSEFCRPPSKTKSIVPHEASLKNGAFVVAPCPHDGRCPLENSDKYCHFVQRLERTSSQRAYKRSKGVPLRGYEDEKFCYVALRRGKRPEGAWPLDGMKFETLKERHAKRNPEDLIIDYDDQFPSEEDEEVAVDGGDSLVPYTSDAHELSLFHESEGDEEEEETICADLRGGWGRIIYSPMRRGKQVQMDVCRSTKRDASEGTFERVVVTQSKNPTLHFQARRSLWGDLWPF
ncbi:hypothetical protein PR202_gb07243 [Eleusine coracana subsp. coracana]|uniref:Methyltransferase n=1 Tax=Eleusine coracana subsp. coracana TaxID=191504 RepID=A0AAV5EBR5_ELECO|nr:hypothetical protein PR202_gb07243 [Eleusine coracana subsp. coracana]